MTVLCNSLVVAQRPEQFRKQILKVGTKLWTFKKSRFTIFNFSAVNLSGRLSNSCRPLSTNSRLLQNRSELFSNRFYLFVTLLHAMAGCGPLCSFGLIADVHYADIDDGTNFSKTRNRYYRNSLSFVKTAVADWTARAGTDNAISMVLHLGDLIDGFNVNHKSSVSAINTVSEVFDQVGVPVFHIWGNHDLYNFNRKQLYALPMMNPFASGHVLPPTGTSEYSMYFDFAPCPGFRLVIIDCYEISMLGVDDKSKSYQCGEKILRRRNKNEDLNSPVGLREDNRRFVKFNGAVSECQLQWLDDVLRESEKRGEVVLVAGHCPLCTMDVVCLCWNFAEILQVLHRYSCVLAYFSGHAHDEMYVRDEHGIHHLTVQGVIEVPPGANAAHLNVHLYNDRVLVTNQRSGAVSEFQIKKT